MVAHGRALVVVATCHTSCHVTCGCVAPGVDARLRSAQEAMSRIEAALSRHAEDDNVVRQLQWHTDVTHESKAVKGRFDSENVDGASSRTLAALRQENEEVRCPPQRDCAV